jgi:hypothetical protein
LVLIASFRLEFAEDIKAADKSNNNLFFSRAGRALYCSTIEFDFADKTSAGDEKCLMISQRPDKKMFDPECQNIECPQCFLGKIYLEREIGYYCMYCGHQFSAVEIEILIEKIALKSRLVQKQGGDREKPVVEIKELPPLKAKVEHIRRDGIKS